MQEVAQLGGTGNSDVDLAIALCKGSAAPSDDTQWPDLNEILEVRR
jgi:hypothetical protein